ncbi:MAG TPA: hypothetical protein DCG47_03045 [Spirochaetaceae bacterium]|nr:hypothetical protein [Spirochaetaceae bacterium]
MVKTLTLRRMSIVAALALIAASALSCDFLALALPQGAANAVYSYADPRIEKSVYVKGLDEPFGLAVAPDGRAFVIARNGVNEYDAELKLVRSYKADAAEGIDDRESDKGPEEWQMTTATIAGETLTALFGTRSCAAVYLFPSGATAFVRRHNASDLYAALHNPTSFDNIPYMYSETTINPVVSAFGFARALGFDPTVPELYGIVAFDPIIEADGRARYTLNFSGVTPYTAPGAFVAPTILLLPPLPSEFRFQRLFIRGNTILVSAGRGSYLGDVQGLSFAFDRTLGGAPFATFVNDSSTTAATENNLYVLSAQRRESAWLHKLRWLP